MSILLFFIILFVLVIIHELGHFIAAKKNGVRVEEFGFGFPPRIFGIKRGETLYSINLLPIGGFVKVYGEEYNELKNKKLSEEEKQHAFAYKKPWQKTIIIIAGVIMNFLLGWVLFSYLLTQGVPTPAGKVIVEHVQSNSPAAQSGIKVGDGLISIEKDGKSYSLKDTVDLVTVTKKYGDQPITIVIQRGEGTQRVTLTPRKNPPAGQGAIGVGITAFVEKKYPWYQAPFYGLLEAFNLTRHIVVELGKTLAQLAMFQKPSVDVTGPVGIAQYAGQAAKHGSNAVLELVALLSLNLAVINILPFPALDGGRLVFILYEWVSKKRVNQQLEYKLNLVGFILLISLAAFITVRDIMKLYQ